MSQPVARPAGQKPGRPLAPDETFESLMNDLQFNVPRPFQLSTVRETHNDRIVLNTGNTVSWNGVILYADGTVGVPLVRADGSILYSDGMERDDRGTFWLSKRTVRITDDLTLFRANGMRVALNGVNYNRNGERINKEPFREIGIVRNPNRRRRNRAQPAPQPQPGHAPPLSYPLPPRPVTQAEASGRARVWGPAVPRPGLPAVPPQEQHSTVQQSWNPISDPSLDPREPREYNPFTPPEYMPVSGPSAYLPFGPPPYIPSEQPSYNPFGQPSYNPSGDPWYIPSGETFYSPSGEPSYIPYIPSGPSAPSFQQASSNLPARALDPVATSFNPQVASFVPRPNTAPETLTQQRAPLPQLSEDPSPNYGILVDLGLTPDTPGANLQLRLPTVELQELLRDCEFESCMGYDHFGIPMCAEPEARAALLQFVDPALLEVARENASRKREQDESATKTFKDTLKKADKKLRDMDSKEE